MWYGTENVPDLNQCAVGLEQRQVAGHWHLRAGDGGDDQIERTTVGLLPVLVVVGRNVCVGAKLKDLVLLGRLSRNTDDLVRAEGFGEKHSKVAETTDTDNTDRLAWTTTVVSQWRVDRHTTAQHGRGVL